MSSANSSLFSDIISYLKVCLSESNYERVKHDLILRESTLKSEKDQIFHKLSSYERYNLTLSKELEHWKRDHGELLLSKHESCQKLTELKSECELLRVRLAETSSLDLPRLKRERDEFELKLADAKKEVEILKKQCLNWSKENGDLKGEVARVEEEKREAWRREKMALEMCEKLRESLEMAEKCKREELERSCEKKKKVEMELEAITIAATDKYRGLEKRVTNLEQDVAELTNSSPKGPQADGTIKVEKRQERNDKLPGRPSVCETTVQESIPCTQKTSLQPPPIFEITDSDSDDEEFKGIKRKIPSSEASNEREESANSRTNRSKQLKGLGDESVSASKPLAASLSGGTGISLINDVKQNSGAPKQLEDKFGVELDGKSKGLLSRSIVNDYEDGIQDESDESWEYEADMLEAFEKDTKLCMKAVCALYRQHSSLGSSFTGSSSSRYRLFNEFSTVRVVALAKFLVNGDREGRLKRSIAELEKFDPNGVVNCRNIAFNHSTLLFEIYKKKADPFFAS